jgi:hypothetical protein
MNKELLVIICGAYSIGFAIFHLAFWKLFDWKNDLKNVSLPNKAIMQILNIRLIYIFLLTAFICFYFPEELYSTRLGKTFLIGNSLFWLGRTVEQFIFLRINNRIVHLLSFLFFVGFIIFLLPAL